MKFNLFVFVMGRVTKKEISSQWCTVEGQEAMEHKLKRGKFILGKIKKNLLPSCCPITGPGCPEILLSLHPWRYVKTF